jgi:hypothetical protein
MRLLNSINNTPISECCDDRANPRIHHRTDLPANGRSATIPEPVAIAQGSLRRLLAIGFAAKKSSDVHDPHDHSVANPIARHDVSGLRKHSPVIHSGPRFSPKPRRAPSYGESGRCMGDAAVGSLWRRLESHERLPLGYEHRR